MRVVYQIDHIYTIHLPIHRSFNHMCVCDVCVCVCAPGADIGVHAVVEEPENQAGAARAAADKLRVRV
jgi:hypothetical protein